ncbi:MAG TPA: C45 family peptidase [Streptosporangiaceae bacterium]|nr:C45 family peptidase [Streptosporangiaceae bacterium]
MSPQVQPTATDGRVPLIRAGGDPFDVGYQHGAARAAALREFLDDGLCRINKLTPEPTSLSALGPELDKYSRAIASATPALTEELAGLASGAGITADEAMLLQVRREIIGYRKVPARGDCTTYASLTAGPAKTAVLAQTVDLNGNLDDQLAVLDLKLSGSRRRALVLSFGGQLGYLGINSDGLAIGLNLVLGGTWHPGLPPYLAIRHLLDTASSVAEALDVLATLPLASSRSLTFCDPGSLACVEILGDQLRVTAFAGQSAHTNHYLHPDFAAADELNVFARNFSEQRLRACEAGLASLAELPAGAGAEEHMALLCQPNVCVAGNHDIRRERTVAAVVMLPSRGELHLRPGNPSASSTVTYRIPLS